MIFVIVPDLSDPGIVDVIRSFAQRAVRGGRSERLGSIVHE